MQKRTGRILSILLIALLLLPFSGCSIPSYPQSTPSQTANAPLASLVPTPAPTPEDPLSPLTLTVVDVAHGDFLLVQGDGKTMVVDTGEETARKKVRQTLDSRGITTIDVLLLTHPHTDHIGNAAYILKNYDVKEVYLTGKAHTTKTYRDLLDALEEKPHIPVREAKPGVSFSFAGANCTFFGPLSLEDEALNNTSAVLLLSYGTARMLLTGDLELSGEGKYIDAYGEALQADVLKIGHHGTDSTGVPLQQMVKPTIAIISMRPLEEYTEKNQEKKLAILQSLKDQFRTQCYRTDSHGDVSITTDGISITVATEKAPK
ncbi:MBL fold metallo-hydrolase [Eubacteriales bacterium OttesenSCG-928-M02]|nr:MBL fold metallo-hydrolase [Eubacteriales bacterium OttesenSCG-928-M02]